MKSIILIPAMMIAFLLGIVYGRNKLICDITLAILKDGTELVANDVLKYDYIIERDRQ